MDGAAASSPSTLLLRKVAVGELLDVEGLGGLDVLVACFVAGPCALWLGNVPHIFPKNSATGVSSALRSARWNRSWVDVLAGQSPGGQTAAEAVRQSTQNKGSQAQIRHPQPPRSPGKARTPGVPHVETAMLMSTASLSFHSQQRMQ